MCMNPNQVKSDNRPVWSCDEFPLDFVALPVELAPLPLHRTLLFDHRHFSSGGEDFKC